MRARYTCCEEQDILPPPLFESTCELGDGPVDSVSSLRIVLQITYLVKLNEEYLYNIGKVKLPG